MTVENKNEHIGLAFVVSIPMTFIQALWGGYVLMKLWGWFIVTTFTGAPQLNLAEAIGLDLVVSMLTLRRVASSNEDEGLWESMFMSLGYVLLGGALLLFIGFIVKGSI